MSAQIEGLTTERRPSTAGLSVLSAEIGKGPRQRETEQATASGEARVDGLDAPPAQSAMPGSTSLGAFGSSSQMLASLAGVDDASKGPNVKQDVKVTAKESAEVTDDGKGGTTQKTTSEETSEFADGSSITSKQTEERNQNGEVKTTTEVVVRDTSGSVKEQERTVTNPDGGVFVQRKDNSSRPTDAEGPAEITEEDRAALARRHTGVADPASEATRAARDAGRLARGTGVLRNSVVKPSPSAEPRSEPVAPRQPGMVDPAQPRPLGAPKGAKPVPVPHGPGPRGLTD